MLNIIRKTIKNNIKQIYIIVPIITIFIVSICAEGQNKLESNIYIKDLIIDEILKYSNSDYIKQIECYNSYNMLNSIMSLSELYLVLSLSSITTIMLFCDARNSGYDKLMISRIGVSKYMKSIIISCIVTSAITIVVGMLLVTGVIYSTFPMGEFTQKDLFLLFCNKIGNMIMIAVIAGIIGLLMVVITKNKFLSIVTPVLIAESIEQITQLRSKWNLYEFGPRKILSSKVSLVRSIFMISVILVLAIFCYNIYRKRVEKGE